LNRFITSLTTAKIYPTPLSIDALSNLFQDFYLQAESHISTHIQALSSKQSRDISPAPSASSQKTAGSKPLSVLSSKASKETLSSDKTGVGQQMLTPSEISERRRARKMLEYKRIALEEAVERRVCEGIYKKIWRHKSSLDEVRDEKLRSRTAALSLVGIGLKDLGIEFDNSDSRAEELEAEIEGWIVKAREGLLKMNDFHYPLGKLQSLAATHQNIVDFLSNLHQSSSSADEILPTLIYTLIKCPPEGINVISNLSFIQRFRSANKINGEAAYCLTNLEAAITFLETVDLATLRSEEAIESSSKPQSHVSTPITEAQEFQFGRNVTAAKVSTPATTPLTAIPPRLGSSSSLTDQGVETKTASPMSPAHSRRLSTLFQPSANALGAASDAVRNSADQGFRNISTTLDSSFKLLFGKLKEQHIQGAGTSSDGTILLPKTLDDARRLVSPKPALDEDGNISEHSSIADQESPREDRLLEIASSKTRDRSADSASSSGKRVAFHNDLRNTTEGASGSPPMSAPISALESMRSLGTTLNPLNRFAGVNVMRGFGRSTNTSPATTPSPLATNDTSKELRSSNEKSLPATAKIDPPVQRFLDASGAGDLKIGEIEALLADYQRLAKVVKDMRLC
jgi:hypothetical protein